MDNPGTTTFSPIWILVSNLRHSIKPRKKLRKKTKKTKKTKETRERKARKEKKKRRKIRIRMRIKTLKTPGYT